MQPTLKYKSPYPLQYAREGDSGMDVKANMLKPIILLSGQTRSIPTGVYLEILAGFEVQVRPKSSLSAKGILAHFGTVDCGYRGEVLVTLSNLNTNGFMHTIKQGDKIAQLVLVPIIQAELVQVDSISIDTERGTGGHGSTN